MKPKKILSIIIMFTGSLLLLSSTGISGPPLQMKKTVRQPATQSPTVKDVQIPKQVVTKVYSIEIKNISLTSQCRIEFKLKNTGADLNTEQHKNSYVKVGQSRSISLAAFDPDGRLKKNGQTVTSHEKAPLTKDTNVFIEVTLFNGTKTSKQKLLTPTCSKPTATIPAKRTEALTIIPTIPAAPPPPTVTPQKVAQPTTPAPTVTPRKAAQPQPDTKTQIPKSLIGQRVEAQKKLDIGEQQPVKFIASTRVKADNMIGAVGDTVPLKATLCIKANENPVPSQKLLFYISGQFGGQGTTDKNGKAKIDYKVPNEIGSKEILVKFAGSEKYRASSDTANIGMIKSSSKINLEMLNPNLQKYSGGNVHLKGKLSRITDTWGIKGREIIIEAQGKYVNKVVTSENYGRFSYSYSIPADFTGNLKLGARFEGDPLYLGSLKELTVNVLPPKQNVYLFWNSVAGQVGQTVTVNVKAGKSIFYSSKNGVGGLHLSVYRIKGDRTLRMAEGYTDSNGRFNAAFKLEHDPGKFRLETGLIGSSDLYTINAVDRGKRHMTVTKSPVAIYVNGSTTARIGDKLMFTVIVHRTSANEGIDGLPVRFEDGQVKNTSHMGSAVFFYTIPSSPGLGNRTIKATTKETTRYLAGSGAITVNVLPKND